MATNRWYRYDRNSDPYWAGCRVRTLQVVVAVLGVAMVEEHNGARPWDHVLIHL
jgi:hypothetical protein